MSKSTCTRPARRAIVSLSVCPTPLFERAGSASSPLSSTPVLAIPITKALPSTCPPPAIDQYLMVGELSLDGSIRPVRGALSVAVCARNQGIPNLVLPFDNAAEAAGGGGG